MLLGHSQHSTHACELNFKAKLQYKTGKSKFPKRTLHRRRGDDEDAMLISLEIRTNVDNPVKKGKHEKSLNCQLSHLDVP